VSPPRPKSFADRLPKIVTPEEQDISHLSDEMADILYPGRRQRTFRMGIVFETFSGTEYDRALALARRSPVYRENREGDRVRHQAAFDTSDAEGFRDLYQLVGHRAGTEVLVDGKRVPYAREIWMPLYFIHLGSKG
jgi:hypothetical protein